MSRASRGRRISKGRQVELGKNITLGRYVPGESAIHRLDPRMKVVGWTIFAVGLFMAGTFSGLFVLASFLAAIVFASRLPPGYVLRGLRPMLPFLVVMYLFQLAFSTSLYPDSRNEIVFHWAFVTVTGEGLYQSTLVTTRVIILFLSVTVLTLTTSLVMLVDAVERLTAPLRRVGVPNQELALAGAIAVRFVPTLIEEAEKLVSAQMARGAKLDVGSWLDRTRARLPLLVPLMIGTLQRADGLVSAMNSRCYRGGDGRTKRRQLHMQPADWIALAVTAVAASGAVIFRFSTTLP